MENLTQMEQTAIQEARRGFAEALIACGFGHELERLTGEQVDMVIERTWDALRASMMRQSATGQIPFPLETSAAGSTSTVPPWESGPPPQDTGSGAAPPGYFINAAGHLLKKDSLDDEIPF